MKGREVLTATRQALAACAGEVETDYADKIQAAAQAVEAALAVNPGRDAGDLPRLQAAIGQLDEMTKPLADLLMDRAMEAMLRKRGLLQ